MFFGSNKILGLDIGASTIKLVEIEGTRKITLTSFGYVPTPRGAVHAGEIIQPEQVTQAIIDLVNQTKTKRKKTVVGISGTAMITKRISVPRMEENLLAEQLRWEAEQYIPFDVNEINLGYSLLKNTQVSSEQMNILLIAAKKDLVFKYAEVVEAAGLNCIIADVNGFALSNCYNYNYASTGPRTVGLMSMGASLTQFVVIENGDVTFCRDIPVGGITFTSDIQKTMGISFDEAEALKISAGRGQPVPQEVMDSINLTCESITDEIRRSFDFYLATAGDVSISKFFVTGGGFSLKTLREKMQTVLGVGLESFNPFQTISYDHRAFNDDFIHQISPFISIGLGLAMRQTNL
ncbi:MAG: type IV pilus assembly protein PilM [Oligoflexia bacterium]|nr:type IV pilus assembly protein PilM [Oligoflexia bacterium]